MMKFLCGLILASAAASVIANPQCAEYEKLRNDRDKALKTKDFKQYCVALSGLIRIHPVNQNDRVKLACEAVTTNGNVDSWLKIRPSIIATMQTTYDQQCK